MQVVSKRKNCDGFSGNGGQAVVSRVEGCRIGDGVLRVCGIHTWGGKVLCSAGCKVGILCSELQAVWSAGWGVKTCRMLSWERGVKTCRMYGEGRVFYFARFVLKTGDSY